MQKITHSLELNERQKTCITSSSERQQHITDTIARSNDSDDKAVGDDDYVDGSTDYFNFLTLEERRKVRVTKQTGWQQGRGALAGSNHSVSHQQSSPHKIPRWRSVIYLMYPIMAE